MLDISPRLNRLVKLLSRVWAVFLWYGPVAIFVVERFHWQLSQILLNYLFWPIVVSFLGALGTALAMIFVAPWRAIVPFLLFTAGAVMTFSPLGDILSVKSFADYIKPETVYVKKHCAPVDFVQDGKTYWFGACDLKLDNTGQVSDLTFYYDTSGDLENYDSLPVKDKQVFVSVVRKYFRDDPNEPFEHAYYTTTRFYRDFFDINFADEDAGGFTSDFGMPPKDPKNPYAPIFQEYPK
jgi:hypothetical protein